MDVAFFGVCKEVLRREVLSTEKRSIE